MAILSEMNSAGDIHRHAGIDLGGRGGVEDIGAQADFMRTFGDFDLLGETLRGITKHEQAPLDQAEVLVARQFDEKSAAFQIQVAQQFARGGDMLRGGMPIEKPAPAGQRGIETRPHEERAPRIEHPAQALGHHAGRGQRSEVAGDNHARISRRAIVATLGLALDNRHREPALQRIIGRT